MNGIWWRRTAASWVALAVGCGGAASTSAPVPVDDAAGSPETSAPDAKVDAGPTDTVEVDDVDGPSDASPGDTSDVPLFDEDAGPTDEDADATLAVDVADDTEALLDTTDTLPGDAVEDAAVEDVAVEDVALEDVALEDVAVEDVAADDATADDVASNDAAGGDDAGDIDEPLPPLTPAACEAAVPRRLFDRVVLAGPTGLLGGLYDGANLESFGPAFATPPSPPTARPGAIGSAELFVSSADAGGCRVRALTGLGVELASVVLPATECGSPIEVSGELVQALTDGDAGRLVWLSSSTLATLATVALPAPVTSATVRVDNRVAVGSGSAVVVADTSGIVVSAATGLPRVRRVLVPSPGLLIAFGGKGADDFGDAFVRLAYDGSALDAADPVALPGPAVAEPIALADCDGAIANGGSHWWCPGGLIVAAGSGWLSAYDATTGLLRGEGAVTMDVTGLAATDDGFVYNGGSHWLGGWDFGVADFLIPGPPTVTSLMASSAAEPQCVSSPLPQEDGTIVFVAAGALHRVSTASGELGPGWTRAGGDAEGSGSPRGTADPCPGTDVRLYSQQFRRRGNSEIFKDAALAASGDVYVAGGVAPLFGGPNAKPQLWRLSEDGEQRWATTLLNGPGEERPALAVAPIGDRLAAVATRTDPAGLPVAAMNVVALDGTVVFDQALTDLDTGTGVYPRAVFGVVRADATSAVLIGNVPSQSPSHLWATRVEVAGAAPVAPLYDVSTPMTAPIAFSTAQTVGSSIWVLGREDSIAGEASAIVVSVAPATGQVEWTQRHGAPGVYARAIAVVETPTGASIAEERFDLTTYAGAIVRVDSAGNVLEEIPLDFVPVGIALLDGREVVAPSNGQLTVLDGSATDTFSPLSLGTSGVFAGRLFVRGRTPILVGGAMNVGVGDFIDLIFARVDAYGRTSCSASGRCVAANCDDGDPCTIDGCDRSTGACTSTPRSDGVTCGAGLSCAGGVCQ